MSGTWLLPTVKHPDGQRLFWWPHEQRYCHWFVVFFLRRRMPPPLTGSMSNELCMFSSD